MTGPAVSGSTPVTAYKYDADGNLTETDTPDGNKILDTYDKDDRLTGQLYNNPGGSTVQTLGYTLDADGRITPAFSNVSSSNFSSNSENYAYDNDGREIAVNAGSGSSFVNEDYTYDTAGNRLSATTGSTHVASIGVGTGNRINNDASGSVGYDADGNRVNRSGGSTTVSYTFNAADQMTGASQTTSGSTNFTASYWYDPLTGQRMAQSVTAGTTTAIQFYIYDPQTGNPLLTLNGSGQVTERDLPGPGPGQTLAVDTGMTGSGAGTVAWLLTDNVGTVTDVVNNAGAVTDHVTYDSFGNVTAQSNASAGTRFGFEGTILDPLTGLNITPFRPYTAADGTFVRQDPTGFGGGDYNLYRYAGGDPGTFSDPTGLDTQQNSGFSLLGAIQTGANAFGSATTNIVGFGGSVVNVPIQATGTGVKLAGGGVGAIVGLANKDAGNAITSGTNNVGNGIGNAGNSAKQLVDNGGNALGGAISHTPAAVAGIASDAGQFADSLEGAGLGLSISLLGPHSHPKPRALSALEKAKLLELANMAENAYDEGSCGKKAGDVGDWHREAGGRKKSNLAWVLYHNKNGKYALVFKDTEGFSSLEDWINNFEQGLLFPADQYDEAIQLAQDYKKQYGNDLELVGHSLGGGLASAAALATNLNATVFNPAGVSSRYGPDLSNANTLINVYIVNGEILTTLEDGWILPHWPFNIPPRAVGHLTTLNPASGPPQCLGGMVNLHVMKSVIDAINAASTK